MTNATASGLTLGSTSNLLNGFQAVWDRSDSTKTPLYLSKNQPLNPENISLQSKGKDWGQIEITLCDSANDVITELYSYDVLQLANDTTDYPSGALVLDNYNKAAIYKSIQTLTGIDFSASAGGYALITIKREEGTQQYSQGGMHAVSSAMSEQFSKITKQLAAPLGTGPASLSALGGIMSGLTQDDIQLFMSFFEDYGSHYVSGVTTGDVIYQIFAYDSANYSTIKQYYTANPDKLYGTSALSFQAYTNPVHQTGGETYGYASQVGTLTTVSGDSSFAKSVANKNWYDSTYKVTSILTQILNNPDLTVYNEVVTIGISLTELLDIVSFRMQITANRIFKALMYTKYAEDIDADFRNIAPYDYNSIFPDSVVPGMVSYLATTDINVYKERLDLSEVLVVVPSEVEDFNLMTQVSQMANAAQFVCPGNSVSLLAHTFDFSSGNHPSIQLTDTAFSTAEVACQYFWGDLTLKNTTGTSVKTIIDGFSYQITSSTVFSGKNTVEITGSVRQSPSSALITNNVDNIELSIAAAEFILNAAAGTPQAGARNLMLDYLNWIGNAIPSGGNNDELKMRALYLARISAQLNFQGKSVPLLTYAAYTPMSDSLQNALNTIQTQIMGIQNAIQSRKLQEQMIKDTDELKKGIEQTGNEVACLIQAQMQNEELVSSYYGSIVSSQQTSLDQLKDTIKTLQQSLALQKGVVNGLVASFKDAAADCEISEILSDVLGLAKNIFSLGKDIAAPELAVSDVVKDLFDTAESIQTLMNAISEFADLDGQISGLTDKLNSLGGLGTNGVSILSLDTMGNI